MKDFTMLACASIKKGLGFFSTVPKLKINVYDSYTVHSVLNFSLIQYSLLKNIVNEN